MSKYITYKSPTIPQCPIITIQFYTIILKFISIDIIPYISIFMDPNPNPQSIFTQIQKQLNSPFSLTYSFLKHPLDNTILQELANPLNYSQILSKLVLMKLVYNYDFSKELHCQIKTLCKQKLETLIFSG